MRYCLAMQQVNPKERQRRLRLCGPVPVASIGNNSHADWQARCVDSISFSFLLARRLVDTDHQTKDAVVLAYAELSCAAQHLLWSQYAVLSVVVCLFVCCNRRWSGSALLIYLVVYFLCAYIYIYIYVIYTYAILVFNASFRVVGFRVVQGCRIPRRSG